MYISKLELIGFKSFANRASLEFSPGVMVVVGPNGCGKTNVVDAVRWVLGEQRSSAIRADRMEAVIFNGTSRRKPLSMAEVSLTIENDKGVLPSPYTEIVLTRRLFRSGESEYLINRQSVRLRDIQDLFSDTGFGHSTYSIMELSMVEKIITGASESRRLLIDEAAGIAKFKSRRSAAERRLETTRDNLARVDDIYGEVEKQFRLLKRQAGRAKHHRELGRAVHLMQVIQLGEERLQLKTALEPLAAKLDSAVNSIERHETESEQLTAALTALEAQEMTLLDALNRNQDALKKLERRDAEISSEIALAEQRLSFLTGELKLGGERRLRIHQTLEIAQKRHDALKEEFERLTVSPEQDAAALSELKAELNTVQDQAANLSQELQRLQEQEAGLSARYKNIEQEQRRSAEDQQRLQARVKNLQAERGALSTSMSETRFKLDSLQTPHQEARQKVKDVSASIKELESKIEALRSRETDGRQALATIRTEVAALKAELSAHRAGKVSRDNWPTTLKQIAERRGLETVAERMDCPEEYKIALTSALESVLDAVDISSVEEVESIAADLKPGARVAVKIDAETSTRPNIELAPPAGEWTVISAMDLIQGNSPLAVFLCNRLARVVIVPQRLHLFQLSEWARQNSLTLVAMTGEKLECDGLFVLGSVEGAASPVGWKRKLATLERRFADAQVKEAQAAGALQAIVQDRTQTESKLTQTRMILSEAEHRARKFDDEIARLSSLNENLERKLTENSGDLDELQQRLQALTSEMPSGSSFGKLRDELEEIRQSRQAVDEKFKEIERLRIGLIEQRSIVSARQKHAEEQRARIQEELKTADQTKQSGIDEAARLDASIQKQTVEHKRTAEAISALKAQAGLVRKEMEQLTTARDALNADRSQQLEQRNRNRSVLESHQKQLREISQAQLKMEAEFIQHQERLREIERRITEDLALKPEDITSQRKDDARHELSELGYGDANLSALKHRIEALGPVNMLAVEELAEVEQRYKFLSGQREDLLKGVDILEDTIERINHEAKLKFRQTFDEVNKNFQTLFRDLFDGGEACMTLEGDDPLEGDIRIFATPSGKKLQNLTMLSGGEKSLTAIALLFAIYLVRPSPFCVLDEIDAPLDDANVLRFNRLLAKFTNQTQFLVVSHNKRTMEAGNSLFGVTLGEDGSSQLVSVRIERDKLDAAPEKAANA